MAQKNYGRAGVLWMIRSGAFYLSFIWLMDHAKRSDPRFFFVAAFRQQWIATAETSLVLVGFPVTVAVFWVALWSLPNHPKT